MSLFVVGSGRCGSTLLTNLLYHHPDVLVLSEYFASLPPSKCFSEHKVSGAAFADLLRKPHPLITIALRRGEEIKEALGGADQFGSIPAILFATLPTLTDRPEELLGEIVKAIESFPAQSYIAHHKQLFSWLADRFNKKFCIERSGCSNIWLPELAANFPDARFVHLHRDGPESALSMRNHPSFRLAVSFLYDPPSKEEVLKSEYAGCTIDGQDSFSSRLAPDYMPLRKYGEYWSYQEIIAYSVLAHLPKDQWISVEYEKLVASPHEVLEQISDFFGLPERDQWINDAARIITGQPPSRLNSLPADQQLELLDSCQPGQLLLNRDRSSWITPTLRVIEDVATAHS